MLTFMAFFDTEISPNWSCKMTKASNFFHMSVLVKNETCVFLLESGRQNDEIIEYFSLVLCERVEAVP